MATKQRVKKLEQEHYRRFRAVSDRILPQLSNGDLEAITGPGFEQFTDDELTRMAAGLSTPNIPAWDIPEDVLLKLCDLTTADERRLLGLVDLGFKHPHGMQI